MGLRFDAMPHSNLGNENSDVGHIKCSRGPQVPHPCFNRIWTASTGQEMGVCFYIPKPLRWF